MSKKDDSILFGAKRAGVTYLYKFRSRKEFTRAQAGAKRLGMSLSQLLCGEQELPQPRKFTDEDWKASKFSIQITECDPFTRRCLERQAVLYECNSAEEYILDCMYQTLLNDEQNAILDPETGDPVLTGLGSAHTAVATSTKTPRKRRLPIIRVYRFHAARSSSNAREREQT